MAISKGLCAGYLPQAATLATETVYEAFLGSYTEQKSFFHGHTFTGNPLACAVALKNLELFEENNLLDVVQQRSEQLAVWLQRIADLEHVGDVRQCGLAAGIELVRDKATKEPYPGRKGEGSGSVRKRVTTAFSRGHWEIRWWRFRLWLFRFRNWIC